jgi:hypothetical protein
MRELDVRHVSDVAPPSPVPVAEAVVVLTEPVIDLTTPASGADRGADLSWLPWPDARAAQLGLTRSSRTTRTHRRRRNRQWMQFVGVGIVGTIAVVAGVFAFGGGTQPARASSPVRKAGDPIVVASTAVVVPSTVGTTVVPARFCGTVGGSVFGDRNFDGIRQSNEAGVAGYRVDAYDDANKVVASAVTGADGNFTLAIPGGVAVRVEFNDPSGQLAVAPHGAGGSATSIAYPQAPDCRVVYGVVDPAVTG